MDGDDLYLTIDQLGTHNLSGDYYRHTTPRRDALSGRAAAINSGRRNIPSTETLYLTAPRETCVAEFRRMANGQGRGPTSFLPRALHTIAVKAPAIVDLTSAGTLEAVGLDLGDLRNDDWSPCQRVGDAIDTLGLGGLLAPSATGDGVVLAVFLRHAHRGELEVTSSEALDDV